MEHDSAERANPAVVIYRAFWRALGIRKPRRALRRLLLLSAQAVLVILVLFIIAVLTWPDLPM